jgi:DNA-directed RNA polymerase subunit RPC12/RpoP
MEMQMPNKQSSFFLCFVDNGFRPSSLIHMNTTVPSESSPPVPFQPIWPMKSWWEEDSQGRVAPPCPKCGEKVRPDGAGSHNYMGLACPPWNAGWDGRCAACGHEIVVKVEQQTGFRTKRVVQVLPAESFHEIFRDEGMVFGGVRIRVEETAYYPKETQVSEIFLSMGELMSLVRELEGPARVLQSQMDWSCDWT